MPADNRLKQHPGLISRVTFPTSAYIRSKLWYDYATGVLYWRDDTSKTPKTRTFGSKRVKSEDGYLYANLDRKTHPVHRIVMIYHHGDAIGQLLQEGYLEIDHFDHDKCNNKLSNLRLVTTKINAHNRAAQFNNTSGYPGVSYRKDVGKWRAYIYVDRKQKNLYLGSSKRKAIIARRDAELAQGVVVNETLFNKALMEDDDAGKK